MASAVSVDQLTPSRPSIVSTPSSTSIGRVFDGRVLWGESTAIKTLFLPYPVSHRQAAAGQRWLDGRSTPPRATSRVLGGLATVCLDRVYVFVVLQSS